MLTQDDTHIRTASVYPVEFWQDTDQLPDGTLVTVDYVKWVKKGNTGHGGVNKVARLKREDVTLWDAIEPFYNAWKNKMDAPVVGTPIDLFPSVTPKMSVLLKTMGYMSVEDLAACTDADLGRIGMGASTLRDKARVFVGLKNGDQKASAQIVDLNNKLEALRVQNEELVSALKELKENGSVETKEPKKRGRRPRKETE